MVTPEPIEAPCPCYRCSGSVLGYDDHGPFVRNNVHGKLQPCPECGRAMTEYVDLGTKGHYECWWCGERAAGPDPLEAVA